MAEWGTIDYFEQLVFLAERSCVVNVSEAGIVQDVDKNILRALLPSGDDLPAMTPVFNKI